MMREIKFRAWDKNLKKFHYPDLWDNSMPSNWRYWYELNQWTGLKDQNGIEIYEGDIVRILYTDWPSNPAPNNEGLDEYKKSISQYGEVIFSNMFGGAEYELANQDWRGSISPGRHGEIEVIGNIHQNPELLKGA